MFMCSLIHRCRRSLKKSSSWHEKMNRNGMWLFSLHSLGSWWILFFFKRTSLLIFGAECNFNCVPLDISLSPTMCWIYVWQIPSHNASLIYSCPQVYPIIINETSEIQSTLLSVVLTGLRGWRIAAETKLLSVTNGKFDLELCVTTVTRDDDRMDVFAKLTHNCSSFNHKLSLVNF